MKHPLVATIFPLAAAMLTPLRTNAVQSVGYEPEFYEVSEKVVTPHVAWARPYAGGGPRVLFIAPWFCHRHTVELVQRLDCDYTVAMTTVRGRLGYDEAIPSYAWVKGLFQEEVEEELRRALRSEYDVIVLGTDWKTLPLWAVHEVLKKVEAGAGLLIGYRQQGEYLDRLMSIGTDDDVSRLLEGIPWTHAANLGSFGDDEPLFRVSSLGAGRVLQLQYAMNGRAREYITPLEETPASRQDYEIYQCIAIRALLWCAKREPPVTVVPVAPGPTDKAPDTLALSVHSPETIWRARVHVEWAGSDGEILSGTQTDTRLRKGETKVELPTPVLPAGLWFGNIRVLRDGEVVGWGCTPVTGTIDVTIDAISFEEELFDGDAPLRFTLKLSAPAEGGTLRFRITDAHGRVVRTASQPLDGAETGVTCSLALPPPLSVWHRLDVELLAPGREFPAAVAQAEFFREWRVPEDEFTLLTWYGPAQEGYMDRLINRAFAAAGVDVVYPSHVWGEGVDRRCIESVRAGLAILPYICHVGASRDAKAAPHVRVPALHDPAYREKLRAQVRDCARQFRRFCPIGYSLGDENYFPPGRGEYCAAPSSVAYFREWLRRRYGTIDALNQAWHSSLTSFDQAQPVFLDDARQAGEPAPWIDFRLCMEDSWTGVFSDLKRTIAEVDPDGKVGHEGSGGVDSFRAFDWWSMLRDLSLFVPYPGRPVQGNLVRSLRNPGTMSGYWYGSYTFSCGGRRPTTQRYFPWYCLFQAYNSSWYFNSYGHASMAHEVGFAPDLRPLPHFQTTARACAEIKTGFDTVLLNGKRASDGIAVYYSPTAIHENTFRNRRTNHDRELDGICKLLNDLSLQYDFVAYNQVRDGVLGSGEYRVLVLPLAMAMPAAEAEAVREFAAKGGAVLADLPPAVADRHGHAYAEQPLAELFGEQPSPDALTVAVAGDADSETLVRLGDDTEVRIPGPVRTGTARADGLRVGGRIGDRSVVLSSAAKRVVLLNLTVDEYARHRHEPQGAALRQLFAGILGEWGVRPPARVLDPHGAALGHVEVVRFTNGAATFLGIMPEDFNARIERTRQAVVHLEQPAHVYDMREKRYLGHRDTLPLSLRTCDAELFALLPYVVGRLDLQVGLDKPGHDPVVTCSGTLLDADGRTVGSPHAVRLDLVSPTGRAPPFYRRKTLTDEGGAFGALWTLAENDPPGVWTIEAVDVATGIEERVWVRVE